MNSSDLLDFYCHCCFIQKSQYMKKEPYGTARFKVLP